MPSSIVAIGDSFTHGNTHRESYPRVLERYTGRSVLNLGLVCASPQTAYEALSRYGVRKSPGVVVLGIFYGNDFQDMALYSQFVSGANCADAVEVRRPRESHGQRLDRAPGGAASRVHRHDRKTGRALASCALQPGSGTLVPTRSQRRSRGTRP